jgi:hypothetical protein
VAKRDMVFGAPIFPAIMELMIEEGNEEFVISYFVPWAEFLAF